MKKGILIAIATIVSLGAIAQPTPDDIGLIQSAYGMEKRAIVEQYMKLTSQEATPFWKIYDEYEVSRKDYGKKRIAIITEYAKNYDALSDDKAKEIVKNWLKNQGDFAKLQDGTFNKLCKVMTAKRAAQFTQLENYLETVIRLNIANDIPFIGELDIKRKN